MAMEYEKSDYSDAENYGGTPQHQSESLLKAIEELAKETQILADILVGVSGVESSTGNSVPRAVPDGVFGAMIQNMRESQEKLSKAYSHLKRIRNAIGK